MELSDILYKYGACSASKVWARPWTNKRRAWWHCQNPGWLLWIACRVGVDKKLLLFAATSCIRYSLSTRVESQPAQNRVYTRLNLAEKWLDDPCDSYVARMKDMYDHNDFSCEGTALDRAARFIENGGNNSVLETGPANLIHDTVCNLPAQACALIRAIIPFELVLKHANISDD